MGVTRAIKAEAEIQRWVGMVAEHSLWLSTAQVCTETERWDDQCFVQMSWLLRVYNKNHLLLDFPFAKQEGEQVTHKKKQNKKQNRRRERPRISELNMAAETQWPDRRGAVVWHLPFTRVRGSQCPNTYKFPSAFNRKLYSERLNNSMWWEEKEKDMVEATGGGRREWWRALNVLPLWLKTAHRF